jgi:hypothetical protein
MIIWILPSIDSIIILIVRKLREKKKHAFDNNRLQQYTIVYLQITKLSTKWTLVEIFKWTLLIKNIFLFFCCKSWLATEQNVEMLFRAVCSTFKWILFHKKWMISLYSCLMALEFSLHSRCHHVKHFEIDH